MCVCVCVYIYIYIYESGSSFVELGLQYICADRESLYLSLYVLYHTPGHAKISKIKEDKIIYILQRYGLRYNRESERVLIV